MYKFILGEVMSEKKITSQELAEKSGISKRTIDEYRGSRKKEPSFIKGMIIAEALNVDPRELIKEETD